VAALRICAELRFVHADESEVAGEVRRLAPTDRHRLRGGEEPARAGRHDLLLAGDQRHFLVAALQLDDAIVDLARQQAKREAHQAGGMRDHPLDGEMRLAGVGGAEHGLDGRRGLVPHSS